MPHSSQPWQQNAIGFRESHAYTHNFNLMPTHPDNEVLQKIGRNKQKQAASCQTEAKPLPSLVTGTQDGEQSQFPARQAPNCCNFEEEGGMEAIAQPTVSGF